MTATDDLRRRVDNTVDRFFGEVIEFHPWQADTQGGGYRAGGNAGADLTRDRADVVACEVTTPTDAGAAVSGGDQRILEAGVWFSIQEELLGGLNNWRKGDRIYARERGLWFEINYIMPSATRRPNILVVRISKP